MTKDEIKECCICGAEFTGWGNNPEPFEGNFSCYDCNNRFVVPARMCLGRKFADKNLLALLVTIAELGRALTNAHTDWLGGAANAKSSRNTNGGEPAKEGEPSM